MKSFKDIIKRMNEDSQDAGYDTTLETPRELGPNDLIFVEKNAGRSIGEKVILFSGKELKDSIILKNTPEFFQYVHKSSETESHIESVELYRNLWLSIHIPKESVKYL